MKALGVGLGAFAWSDVEVERRARRRRPTVGHRPGRCPGRGPRRGAVARVDHPHRARSPPPWSPPSA